LSECAIDRRLRLRVQVFDVGSLRLIERLQSCPHYFFWRSEATLFHLPGRPLSGFAAAGIGHLNRPL
jgi:hypothetical protein